MSSLTEPEYIFVYFLVYFVDLNDKSTDMRGEVFISVNHFMNANNYIFYKTGQIFRLK